MNCSPKVRNLDLCCFVRILFSAVGCITAVKGLFKTLANLVTRAFEMRSVKNQKGLWFVSIGRCPRRRAILCKVRRLLDEHYF